MYDVCDENHVDTFVMDASNASLVAEEDDSLHSLRTRALIRSDPNHKVALPVLARSILEKLSILCGSSENLQQLLLNSIGNDSLQELQEFLQ